MFVKIFTIKNIYDIFKTSIGDDKVLIRNKYIDINDKMKFIKSKDYINVKTYKDIKLLINKVKNILYDNKGLIMNKATGYTAKITNKTINKIIHPKTNFKVFNSRYIDNLNASCYLKVLFENAIYIDTLKPMKQKANNPSEIGYHHFVAPLKMNNKCYKALITVKERINSKTLYIVSVQIFTFNYFKNSILVKELINNIDIWNYDLQDYNHYDYNNFVAETIENELIWIIT